jgi:hypothetical protein
MPLMGWLLQDPAMELPNFQKELGEQLLADVELYLRSPDTEEAQAMLPSLPGRLKAPSEDATAAAFPATPPHEFSIPLFNSLMLFICCCHLQVRAWHTSHSLSLPCPICPFPHICEWVGCIGSSRIQQLSKHICDRGHVCYRYNRLGLQKLKAFCSMHACTLSLRTGRYRLMSSRHFSDKLVFSNDCNIR